MTTTLDPTLPAVGGPALAQSRRLVTEIPGPRSRELAGRRSAALPAGLSSAAPLSISDELLTEALDVLADAFAAL